MVGSSLKIQIGGALSDTTSGQKNRSNIVHPATELWATAVASSRGFRLSCSKSKILVPWDIPFDPKLKGLPYLRKRALLNGILCRTRWFHGHFEIWRNVVTFSIWNNQLNISIVTTKRERKAVLGTICSYYSIGKRINSARGFRHFGMRKYSYWTYHSLEQGCRLPCNIN